MSKVLVYVSNNSTLSLDNQKYVCEKYIQFKTLTLMNTVSDLFTINMQYYDIILISCFVCFGDDFYSSIKILDNLVLRNSNIKIHSIIDSNNQEMEFLKDIMHKYSPKSSSENDQFGLFTDILCSIRHKKKHLIINSLNK